MRKPTTIFAFALGFVIAALIFRAVPTSAQSDCTPTPVAATQAATADGQVIILSPDNGTRQKPIPLGVTVTVKGSNLFDGYEQIYKVTLVKFLRGESAAKALQSEKLNEYSYVPPKPDMEYLLTYFAVEYLKGSETESDWFHVGRVEVESKGVVREHINSPRTTTPEFNARIFPGAKTEGWIAFEVDRGADVKVVFDTIFKTSERTTVYFSIE